MVVVRHSRETGCGSFVGVWFIREGDFQGGRRFGDVEDPGEFGADV